MPCPKCHSLMIKVALYDPDGEVPLDIQIENGETYCCPVCMERRMENPC